MITTLGELREWLKDCGLEDDVKVQVLGQPDSYGLPELEDLDVRVLDGMVVIQ